MGDAAAIPAHLYLYSDNATRAEEELQRWISAVLAPAIENYRAAAIDYGYDISGITVAAPQPPGSTIDADLYSPLAQVHDLDKLVYDIGQAFQQADPNPTPRPASGPTIPGDGPMPDENLVTTDDLTLDEDLAVIQDDEKKLEQIQQSRAWGRQLADYANQNGIDDYVWQQLKEHLKDPYWLAAFFNGLDEKTFDALIIAGFTKPIDGVGVDHGQELLDALVSAFHSGLLDPKLSTEVYHLLQPSPGDLRTRFRTMFIEALQVDPAAARNFVDGLTNEQLLTLMKGEGAMADASSRAEQQAAFIKVLTAAMTGEPDPISQDALYRRVAGLITSINPCRTDFPAPPSCDPTPTYDAIKGFLNAYESESIGPPPDNATRRSSRPGSTRSARRSTRT